MIIRFLSPKHFSVLVSYEILSLYWCKGFNFYTQDWRMNFVPNIKNQTCKIFFQSIITANLDFLFDRNLTSSSSSKPGIPDFFDLSEGLSSVSEIFWSGSASSISTWVISESCKNPRKSNLLKWSGVSSHFLDNFLRSSSFQPWTLRATALPTSHSISAIYTYWKI